MARGPIWPFSLKFDTADRVFRHNGGSGADTEGLGVQASLGANGTIKLRFKMPEDLPLGTLKLVLNMMTPATVGNARPNPAWAAAAEEGVDLDALALTAEGVTQMVADAVANEVVQAKIELDAETVPAAGEWLVMDLVMETASWTIASIVTFVAYLIYE